MTLASATGPAAEAQSSAYTRAQVAFAARAWTMRSEEERRSAAVFADLLALLADGDAPLEVLREVHVIVGDEIRHADLCARMAESLGAPTPTSSPLARSSPVPTVREERRVRALEIALVEGAIGETISSALFGAGRRAAEEPRTRGALSEILRDEVRHAARYWNLLDGLRLPRDAEHLHAVAARALGAIERTQMVPVFNRLASGKPFDPAWGALGVIPPEARVDAFYRAVENRVLPQLTARGLDGQRAWAIRYR
jgi:hypothetical protein